MSSTNKTAHLQLNQWVGTDPFRMADFNADNTKIDAAVKANAQAIAANATAISNNSKSIQTNATAISNNTKSIQNNASAISNHTTAITALQNGAVRFATGSYTGNGNHGQSNPNSITCPFEPKLVWIQQNDGRYRALFFRNASYGTGSTVVSPYGYTLAATWSNNTLTWYDPALTAASSALFQLNSNKQNYAWFAAAW